MTLGDSDEAEGAYRRAVALPRGAFAYLSLGRFHLHVTRNYGEAASTLSRSSAVMSVRGWKPVTSRHTAVP